MIEQGEPKPYSARELARFRKSIHLTQAEIAEQMGMTRLELGSIERGSVFPIDTTLEVFNAQYLNAMIQVIDVRIDEVTKAAEKLGIKLNKKPSQS